MEINSNTKISELIKANKASIEAIASIAKPLERLKNPILRKVMASRVTIAEAAKMGGTTEEKIAEALENIGFVFEKSADNISAKNPKPAWLLQAGSDDIIRFDVRPIIENGTDPLKEILHQFKETPDGKILCIINSFVPTPLIHLLEKEKAAGSYVETISNNEFHTYFLKKQKHAETQTADDDVMMDDAQSFEKVCSRFPREKIKEIDVRHLEMPLPMKTILGELEILPGGEALYVHHKRVPVYLLEELADKNFRIHVHNITEGNVKMLIFKN